MQVEQLLAPASENVVSGQVLSDDAPIVQKDPAVQPKQLDLPESGWNVPPAQAVFTPFLQNEPASQGVQTLAPPFEYPPLAHTVADDAPDVQKLPAGQRSHTAPPVELWYEPAAQGVWTPFLQKLPIPQLVQLEADPREYVPSGQMEAMEAPETQYEPAGQGVQVL